MQTGIRSVRGLWIKAQRLFVLIIKNDKRIKRTWRKKFFLYLRKNKSDINTAAKENTQAEKRIISSKNASPFNKIIT